MLEEWPLEEAPARASASAGASATLAQTNSASRMRQFINRLDIALPAQKFSRELNVAQIWGAVAPAKHPLLGISAPTGRAPEARPRVQVTANGRSLDCRSACAQILCHHSRERAPESG